MKKEIKLTLVMETDDKNVSDEEIRKDLEREISCCSWSYDITNCTIVELSDANTSVLFYI